MISVDELMKGDWLQNTNGNVGRVIGLRPYMGTAPSMKYEYEVIIQYHQTGTVFSDQKMLQPIPLTPEILEKNGFDISDPEVKQYHFEEDGQRYHFSLRQMYNQKDGKPNGYSFFAFNVLTIIDYVHELQHAFRLCGIEKEIVL